MNSRIIIKTFDINIKKIQILNVKPVVLISSVLFLISFFCSGQDTKTPVPARIPSTAEQLADSINLIGSSVIKKGDIFLKSGDKIAFKNLTMSNDSVYFFSSSPAGRSSLPTSEVKSVTRKKSTVANGALIGATLGLFAGFVTGIAVNSDQPVEEIIAFFSNDDDDEQDFRAEDLPYIGIGIASGAALGALAGLAKKNGKVVYYKNSNVEVFPSIGFNREQQTQFMVSVKINIGTNKSGR